MKRPQQQGFTLIELIVVIVILGILAATALPKFSNLSVDARIAKMNGLAASLKGAAAMAHGQSLASLAAPASSIRLENGTQVDMQDYYPSAKESGIPVAIEFVGSGYVSAISPIPGQYYVFYPDSARTGCAVIYFPANSAVTASMVPLVNDSAVNGASAVINCQ